MSLPSTHLNGLARWALPAILIVAAALRLPGLGAVPPPLSADEASRGYDAWAILETGADRHGQRWPLFLESFGPGDHTAALTTYLTIPFVAMLGPTPTAMRLPDAMLGVATVWLLFVWLRRHAGAAVALAAAAILATDPWHVAITRTAHESGFAPFFLVIGLLALGRSGVLPTDEDGGEAPPSSRAATGWAALGGVMFAFHTWVYPATRLFTPLLCVALVIVYRKHVLTMLRSKPARITLCGLACGLLLGALPMIVTAVTHPERLAARAGATLLDFGEQGPMDVVQGVAVNLAANLDPRYLFLRSDEMSGASIPGVGQHLLVLAPLFVAGLVRMIVGWRKRPWYRLLIVWLVLYPIPAAICSDWIPHPLRTVGGMLVFPIIAAMGGVGLVSIAASLRPVLRRTVIGIFAAAVAGNLAHFAHAYFIELEPGARAAYQADFVDAVRFTADLADSADFVLVTNHVNQPYVYILLYGPIPPGQYAVAKKVVVEGPRGFHQVLRVGKVFFSPTDSPEAVRRFQDVWATLPPNAEGLVIDIDRPDAPVPGNVLARFPADAAAGQNRAFQVRRWRIGVPGSR